MKTRYFTGGLFDGHSDTGEPSESVVLVSYDRLPPAREVPKEPDDIGSCPQAAARYVLASETETVCNYEAKQK